MKYFIYQDEQEKGPYPIGEIIKSVNYGVIAPSTLAREESATEWIEVSSIVDFSIAQAMRIKENQQAQAQAEFYERAGGQEQRAQAQAESIRQVQQALSDVSQWMSRNQGTVIIVMLLIVIGVPFFSQVKPAVKWEYKLESPSDYSFTKTMNIYGEEGWELVSARRASDSSSSMSYECIFKRPK